MAPRPNWIESTRCHAPPSLSASGWVGVPLLAVETYFWKRLSVDMGFLAHPGYSPTHSDAQDCVLLLEFFAQII